MTPSRLAVFHSTTGTLQIYADRDLAAEAALSPMAAAMLVRDLHDYIARAVARLPAVQPLDGFGEADV